MGKMYSVVTNEYIEITHNCTHANVVFPHPETPSKTNFFLAEVYFFNPKTGCLDEVRYFAMLYIILRIDEASKHTEI